MSEDCHHSGDEPFDDERIGPGAVGGTIYTCPRCGGPRNDGMKCLACEQSTYPDTRYAFQRPGWDTNYENKYDCPRCGDGTIRLIDDACRRCGLPQSDWTTFSATHFPHSSVNLHITGLGAEEFRKRVLGPQRPEPAYVQRWKELMIGRPVQQDFQKQSPTDAEQAWLKAMHITWEGDGRAKRLT